MTIWHETNEIHPQDILDAEDESLGTEDIVVYQPPPESPAEETPIVETPNE